MKLKAVEMQGFKSFPDRTKLTFDDGITVIVGPNGSGKSNISDAIKWVFGEQSVKSLRGAKMEDVIFGGSASRKPTGFAWVSLFIDNTGRSIDIDTDEVVITRRLYRSGESEYRINNNPVRLKDINETFMDTGLGRDGYSVIEQGKIAEIVSAKSTQRREIFEEAAGISKFRYRKTEAERKLTQAEDNLIRLRDIMQELEDRVGPLKAQSEKAKQYVVLAEEKKSLEISLWLEQLAKLGRQMAELEDKTLLAANDRTTAQKRLEEIERETEEIQQKTQELNLYIEHKRDRIREWETAISEAKVNAAVKQNTVTHNEDTIRELQDEWERSMLSAGELEEKLTGLREDCALLQKEAEETARRWEESQKALEAKRQEERRLATEQSALALQKQELQENIHRAELSAETAGTLAEETVDRLEALRGQAKNKDENLTRLREELAGHRAFAEELRERLESLQNSKNGYLFKLKSRSDKIAEVESRQRNSEKLAGEKLQRAQVLTDLEKNYESFNNSVKFVMKQAGAGALRGVIGPVSALIRTENRYSTAVEIALGAAIQNIVVQDETAAKRAIALLKERGAGRATFLPLTNIRANPIRESDLAARGGYVGLASELVQCEERYRAVMDSLLGRTIVAEDIDAAAAIAKAYGYRYRAVTLDGQVVNAGGSLTGGSVNKNASILSRRGEIDALTAEAKKYAAQVEELETQLTELRREADTIRATVEGIAAEEKTAREDLISAQTLVSRLTASTEEAEQLNEQALREYDELTARVEELRKQKLTGGELVKKLTEEVARLNRMDVESTAAHTALTEAIEEAARQVTDLQMEAITRRKDCEAAQSVIAQLENQQSGSEAALTELRQKQEQLQKENEAIRAEIEEITAGAAGGGSEIETLRRDIKEADGQKDTLEARRSILTRESGDAITKREAAASELVRLQEKSEAMQEQQNGISTKMWEEYELTRSEAAETAIPLEDVPAAQKRLTELRGRIRGLGAVNVAAIEEYEEVSGRYRFMKEQIDDAENAKKELTRLIAELSAKMSAIFTERFAGINRHFGEIFRELFGGGHAELRLTDATDPLETGIEIIVQPPGKIIKNLSALSGGEQAFVAICIYFAILRVNPAPFVLIDEIEAALDDVNVGKFAAYLHRMTDHTQFISITHRRGTMEQGDVLYGVTMEEEGISKLLRLDVAEMEKKFGKSLN
jgi:chromosome segregation protein SMC